MRVSGFASETDLPYAGVDLVLAEFPDEVAMLPPRLQHALSAATGRLPSAPPTAADDRVTEGPDRFQVGLALLSVLGHVAEPVAVLIDDAHLIDEASLGTLAFVSRRVAAEPVLVVFATRPEPHVLEALAGIEVMDLGGLDTASARELLDASRETALDAHLAVRVVEQLGGHPLAIAELAAREDLERLSGKR